MISCRRFAPTTTIKRVVLDGMGAAAGSGPTVPGAPTTVVAVAGDAQATVTFVVPASNGGSAITGYTVVSSPSGGVDSGGTSTTHVVTGLTNGVSYTFRVTASNVVGAGNPSSPSNAVTPVATTTGIWTPVTPNATTWTPV